MSSVPTPEMCIRDSLRTADLRAAMEAAGLTPAAEGGIAEELLRRPEISYPLLALSLIHISPGATPLAGGALTRCRPKAAG